MATVGLIPEAIHKYPQVSKTQYWSSSVLGLGVRGFTYQFNFMLTYRRKLTEVNFMFIIF